VSTDAEPVATLEVALSHATRLLAGRPDLAALQAMEILNAVPNHPAALLLLAQAERRQGKWIDALRRLEALARSEPRAAAVRHELGLTLADLGRSDEAIQALRACLSLKSDQPDVWRVLADLLDASDDLAGADEARARFIKSANRDPRLMAAAAALVENRVPEAEALLRAHLKVHPTDVAALRMLAEVAARLRRYRDAETLLAHCLELAPSFTAARHNYAVVLFRQQKLAGALAEIETLLAADARNPGYQNLKAAILAHLGDYPESLGIYEQVLRTYPHQPKVWMNYGHGLKTARRREESIAAYRRAISQQPTLGEAYWSLANLKTFQFSDDDVTAMRAALGRGDLTVDDRLHFEYALGKALEDRALFRESFEHYAEGARLRRTQVPYDPDTQSAFVARSKAVYSEAFFAARRGVGAKAPDPIFILGLPRSGSTLLEQILASHSAVEGTMELPDINALVRDLLGARTDDEQGRYPALLESLTPEQCAALGERYLEQTRIQRKSDAPFFIDKMPNNFMHVGFIHLILPNAKIIDTRRHPMACCFSNFKQHFARGQNFSYALNDLGRFYRDYVELMAHFDRRLPGRIHRVIYEQLVDDPETLVRRVLDYCGLPFEAACLNFHENERAVRTASSEQVRRPINRDGVDQWLSYAPWLDPLAEALGPVLAAYPAVPITES
jgi:predicted Zn-dependent protease